ncbi:MAG: hypothetical protein D4S02_04055 [Rhodocyclaceae bacterium]|nr:MAG: hypothetical protein D4S02_04055 [Rhodocyclaceae bacterium]
MAAVAANESSRCLYAPVGIVMYVARLPGIGPLHTAACPSNAEDNILFGAHCYASAAMREEENRRLVLSFDRAMPAGIGLPHDRDRKVRLAIEAGDDAA